MKVQIVILQTIVPCQCFTKFFDKTVALLSLLHFTAVDVYSRANFKYFKHYVFNLTMHYVYCCLVRESKSHFETMLFPATPKGLNNLFILRNRRVFLIGIGKVFTVKENMNFVILKVACTVTQRLPLICSVP